GRARLHHPVHSGGGARPFSRNALRLAEELMDALLHQFFNLDIMARALPLVLLIFIYSGLPFAGIRLSPLAAVALAFFLNTSSYYGEIYRAGIESVGRGQWDAARSTGLGAFDTLSYVVLPQ